MHTRRSIFLLSGLFVFAGAMHFVIPDRYAGIMPPSIPYQLEMVYFTGVAEIAGGLGLLVTRLRKAAAWGLIALLIAVFPANIQMLINAMRGHSSVAHIAMLWLRLPFQPLLIVWLYRSAIGSFRAQRQTVSR